MYSDMQKRGYTKRKGPAGFIGYDFSADLRALNDEFVGLDGKVTLFPRHDTAVGMPDLKSFVTRSCFSGETGHLRRRASCLRSSKKAIVNGSRHHQAGSDEMANPGLFGGVRSKRNRGVA